ncbi:hypothetical protein ACFSCX_10230 [Bacillus salitolerans]|uniref:Uncharacterized protein n=1 Tax=Bacillus salitolerans TaxID=1437434 RepID=A0ABW4LP06_9BACI
MDKNKFRSNAEEIRYYTKKLLSDYQEHSIQEIKKYVQEQTGKEFTDGTYSGALRDLLAKETGYSNISRGIYIREKDSIYIDNEYVEIEPTLNEKVIIILQRTIDNLYTEANSINILNVKPKDLEVAEKINLLISEIQKKIDQFN